MKASEGAKVVQHRSDWSGWRRAGSVGLVCLVAACSSQELPPLPPGSGPGGGNSAGGIGGHVSQGIGGEGPATGMGGGGGIGPGGPGGSGPGGPGGAGAASGGGAAGQGGNTDCLQSTYTCVLSCSTDSLISSNTVSGSCDHNGSLTCPAGYQRVATCAPTACARQPPFFCCDQTIGALTRPQCGLDGLYEACPDATVASALSACFPSSVHVTSCKDLDGQPCEPSGARCSSPDSVCSCQPGDAGLVWNCPTSGVNPVP